MLLADRIIAPDQDNTAAAHRTIGQASAQHTVQHPPHRQQIPDRTKRTRRLRSGATLQISPRRRNERPAAIRPHQQQLQPTSPAHPPGQLKRTPLQRMARPNHPDHRREAIEVGSVSCLPSKLLLRHGIRFDDGPAWTQRHRDWLQTIALEWPAAQATLLDAQGAIDALVHRREQLEREIVALLPDCPWAVQVGRLRCLRGIDTLTAVGLCAEIGDFERFAHAEQLMSYVGLVPSESTTGQQRRLGAITKTGSGHARRLLVEAAWHYRPRPRIGKALTDRQDGQPAQAVAISWSAQRRLHRTWTRLEARAKRRTIIAVAAARELAGFAWAITRIE
ncbi:MAG TPA: transposase [Solirubrobacteraceae bacterium]|jgi:hypothetical protein